MPSTINADNGVSSGSAGLKSTADSSGVLQLQTNGTTAVTVDTSQNVGVGTASPASKLHVAGSFRQTGATAPFEWTVNAGAADYLKLNAVGYADNLIVATSSGNVGIGTSSPGARLAIVGTSGNAQFQAGTTNAVFINAFDSNPIYMTASVTNSTAFGFGAASNIPLFFMTNNTERARIDTSGNLLVGATSTTWNGALVKSAGTISLASGASINLSSSTCGGAIVSVYITGSGSGGLFYLNYSATSVKLAGDGDVTDTGSNFAVYKNASSHVSTLKNKAGSTQTFSVVVVAGQLT